MTEQYCVVMTTFANPSVGKTIIDELINQRLAACVQVMPIQSYYHWQGEVNCDQEHQVMIKTKAALFEQVKTTILQFHDYETPEIIQLPITNGLGDYLAWIDKECC
ncbi:divalent-cation tolerance protein CutA [Photobacterium leiognathi]|uniref:divalent-cation tolerance protein CutA n=1 Tax=Photobacterium leiognathi TaxID=553611 RepID=UPI00020887F9|nr:divalent-cation tolerance protein CutA [Photobacterium leiognathi]PSW54828.1 divalent-cation tolerance protein CutA [Photobacterium leiognathi subsp. mandapamensis]GAA06595.1 divalent-cation tolerance protein cutA [Photobacterium leiognathi subsp. mandapamensis svers.1.1.]